MHIANSLLGMALILGMAILLSSNRRAIRLRVVGAAFALQAGFAALVLYVPAGNRALQLVAGGVSSLLGYAHTGVDFLFGPLARPELGGTSFAISALPVIIFFASLISILYYVGIMPLVIRWIGGGLEKITGISRIESLCAASNIFVGQSEAPLVIRPYLSALTPSQLFCVMSVGMAGVAGTILAAYASMGIRIDYLVAAAFMSAPGGICMAKLVAGVLGLLLLMLAAVHWRGWLAGFIHPAPARIHLAATPQDKESGHFALCHGPRITCVIDGDTIWYVYGRKLRQITRGGTSLGEVLVAEGLAERWIGYRRNWCK